MYSSNTALVVLTTISCPRARVYIGFVKACITSLNLTHLGQKSNNGILVGIEEHLC